VSETSLIVCGLDGILVKRKTTRSIHSVLAARRLAERPREKQSIKGHLHHIARAITGKSPEEIHEVISPTITYISEAMVRRVVSYVSTVKEQDPNTQVGIITSAPDFAVQQLLALPSFAFATMQAATTFAIEDGVYSGEFSMTDKLQAAQLLCQEAQTPSIDILFVNGLSDMPMAGLATNTLAVNPSPGLQEIVTNTPNMSTFIA
jgi:phosphoserine phosphatase